MIKEIIATIQYTVWQKQRNRRWIIRLLCFHEIPVNIQWIFVTLKSMTIQKQSLTCNTEFQHKYSTSALHWCQSMHPYFIETLILTSVVLSCPVTWTSLLLFSVNTTCAVSKAITSLKLSSIVHETWAAMLYRDKGFQK